MYRVQCGKKQKYLGEILVQLLNINCQNHNLQFFSKALQSVQNRTHLSLDPRSLQTFTQKKLFNREKKAETEDGSLFQSGQT